MVRCMKQKEHVRLVKTKKGKKRVVINRGKRRKRSRKARPKLTQRQELELRRKKLASMMPVLVDKQDKPDIDIGVLDLDEEN